MEDDRFRGRENRRGTRRVTDGMGDREGERQGGWYIQREGVYKEFVKHLFCPKYLDAKKMSFDEVRQLSIKLPKQAVKRNPQLWMPPPTALEKIVGLLMSQLEYRFTVGDPQAGLPDFLHNGGLKKTKEGEIEYDMGAESYTNDPNSLLLVEDHLLALKKRPRSRKMHPENEACTTHLKRAEERRSKL